MKKIDHAISELKEMDALAAETSPVHSLHPAVKLIVTVVYILVVVSIDKYDFATLAVMVLYPALMFQLSGTSLALCLYKLRIVLPLVCAVGLLNPFLDKTPMLAVGSVTVTGGVISMITLMLKGIFCVTASYILVATTPFDRICAALRPKVSVRPRALWRNTKRLRVPFPTNQWWPWSMSCRNLCALLRSMPRRGWNRDHPYSHAQRPVSNKTFAQLEISTVNLNLRPMRVVVGLWKWVPICRACPA